MFKTVSQRSGVTIFMNIFFLTPACIWYVTMEKKIDIENTLEELFVVINVFLTSHK